MSLIFSRQCEYALQAVLYIALKPQGEMSSIKEITKKLHIPYHFLGKIMQDLSRKGLLRSLKGPTGGFTLGMPAKDITLFHIVEAIDGAGSLRSASWASGVFGEKSMRDSRAWSSLRDGIYKMLVNKQIADVAKT